MGSDLGERAMDPYAVLGVGVGATAEEIEAAYRRQARLWHPDVSGAEDGLRMQQLNLARDALCGRRPWSEYDFAPQPPRPLVEPGAVDFGSVRPTCRHVPVPVRLLNAGGPPATVRIAPEEGVFWSVREVRGGRAEDEIAEFDFEVTAAHTAPGLHGDVVRLFLDENAVELELTVTVKRSADPIATLRIYLVAVLVGTGAVLLLHRRGPTVSTLTALMSLVLLIIGASAARISWPENWSALWPTTVWFDSSSGLTFKLRHHLRWCEEFLPAGRQWTASRVEHYAQAAGLQSVGAVFNARGFHASTGRMPTTPTYQYGSRRSYVYVPWRFRLSRACAERTVAHQVGHLVWPPHRHDADFWDRVQNLVDAAQCAGCVERTVVGLE